MDSAKALPEGRTADGAAVSQLSMYDVRFIHNVRVAQILFGSTYAEIPPDTHIRPKKKRSQDAAIGVQCGITYS